jgi:hypothetical protein
MHLLLKIVLFLLLFTQMTLCAQIRRDHVQHFGAGLLAGGAGAFVASELSGGNRFWTFSGAVAGSLIAGVAKEAIDAGQVDNKWDNGDLAATAAGGVTIGVTIDLFSAKSRKRKRRAPTASHVPPGINGVAGFPRTERGIH